MVAFSWCKFQHYIIGFSRKYEICFLIKFKWKYRWTISLYHSLRIISRRIKVNHFKESLSEMTLFAKNNLSKARFLYLIKNSWSSSLPLKMLHLLLVLLIQNHDRQRLELWERDHSLRGCHGGWTSSSDSTTLRTWKIFTRN